MTVVVGKNADKKAKQTELMKWYVTDKDCNQEYGSLVILELDGTYKFDTPFAKGSNNVSSAIAEVICNVGSTDSKKAAGKSI